MFTASPFKKPHRTYIVSRKTVPPMNLTSEEDTVIEGGDKFLTSRIQRNRGKQHRNSPCVAVK
jgi:hypothetical protein